MPTTFNTTDPKPGYVYDSATDTWFPLLGIAPGSSVVRWRKTVSGGETSVSGLDDLSATLAYNAGTEQVYLNGVLLVRTEDYLATTGTSITGLTALAASDVIEVISFNATNVQITDALLETDINAKGDLIVGAAVDTAAILASGTNGQVLSVNTATATGLEWVTSDDANAIQNAIVNAKGDIVTATADNTPAILTVGNNGDTLVADSGTATGLRYKEDYAAGKNKIINGDFGIWQRGTSFNLSSVTGYTADRWQVTWNGSGATRTISQQAFTPGTAPVAGYEGKFFYRYNQSVAGTSGSGNFFFQPIEDVQTFAGQTVTASFWAKADASRSVPIALEQNFGSGGSGTVSTSLGTASITTSWTRFTFSVAVPSISGKTIGTSSYLNFLMTFPANTVQTIDIWGVQLEESSVATAFQTATGTIQGELAACQRYYRRWTTVGTYGVFGLGTAVSSTRIDTVFLLSPMRIAPTSIDYNSNVAFTADQSNIVTQSALTLSSGTGSGNTTLDFAYVIATVSGATQFRPYIMLANANASAYIGFSAEL